MADELDFSCERSVTGEELLLGSGRLERLAWLNRLIPSGDLFFLQDGEFSKLVFQEAVDSFVNGQFIAATVLGFSFIERTIAGRLSHVGDKKLALSKSGELLHAALQRRWLTETEHSSLDALLKVRNPIIHFREPLHAERPEIRALYQAKTPKLLVESDARKVLDAAIRLLEKTSI